MSVGVGGHRGILNVQVAVLKVVGMFQRSEWRSRRSQ